MGEEAVGAIARLTQEFSKLPGIGPKSAERITHHLLAADSAQVFALADALRAVKEQVHPCRQCHNLTEGELCSLCRDARRAGKIAAMIPTRIAATAKMIS